MILLILLLLLVLLLFLFFLFFFEAFDFLIKFADEGFRFVQVVAAGRKFGLDLQGVFVALRVLFQLLFDVFQLGDVGLGRGRRLSAGAGCRGVQFSQDLKLLFNVDVSDVVQ